MSINAPSAEDILYVTDVILIEITKIKKSPLWVVMK